MYVYSQKIAKNKVQSGWLSILVYPNDDLFCQVELHELLYKQERQKIWGKGNSNDNN